MAPQAEIIESYKERVGALLQKADSASILSARSEFNDFLKGFVQKSNRTDYSEVSPNALDDLIKSYTDRFERLKFLFLEQEAKEQFFRLVLDPDSKIIDRDEILTSVEKGENLKRVLDQKKIEIDELTSRIAQKSQMSQEFLEEIQLKKEKLLSLVDEIIEKNQELDAFYVQLTAFNGNDPSLVGFQKLKQKNPEMDFNIEALNTDQLYTKLEEIKKKRKDLQARLEELEKSKNHKIAKIEKDYERSKLLITQNEKLTKIVDDIKEHETNLLDEKTKQENLKLLEKERKIALLSELIKKISDITNFSYKRDERYLTFKVKNRDECIINFTPKDKIENIVFSSSSVETIQSIIKRANQTNDPVQAAVTELLHNFD